jgi:hypothetical protein
LVREQAFGEATDPEKLERLGRYEVHLDRKLAQLHVVEHALPQRRDGLCRCHGSLLWIGLRNPAILTGGGRSSMIYSGGQDTARVAKVILCDLLNMARLRHFPDFR